MHYPHEDADLPAEASDDGMPEPDDVPCESCSHYACERPPTTRRNEPC